MLLKDVPVHPAYVVFHGAYMNGAMEVWPATSLEAAQERVTLANAEMDAMGMGEDAGFYRAYVKLPRKKVWKFHS